MGRTLNVSESGILLETHFPIQASQHVTLSIGLEEDLVDIKGRVVHLVRRDSGKYEMGIEFTDIGDDAVETLRSFIRTFNEIQEKGG
jgi:c-di-GMP-binding flagellar brake protein YcgR